MRNRSLKWSAILILLITTPIFAKSQDFVINGEKFIINTENISGQNYVALRDLSEKLGYKVSYDSKNKIVYIVDEDKTVTIDISKGTGKLINEKVYVPVRFVTESFGCKVHEELEATTSHRIIYITKPNNEMINNQDSIIIADNNYVTDDGIEISNSDKIANVDIYYSSAKAYVEDGLKDAISAQFDVTGTPKILLMDKDVVMSGQVRVTNSLEAYIVSNYEVKFYDGDYFKYDVWIDKELIGSNQ
ncbi:MAG: Copper amine oxidase N-terminal domain [Clostridia bacterium]|jgi:hypothetical protein|nr:Copper amine oxidase N-terminal domain [Clostridia bacterium]